MSVTRTKPTYLPMRLHLSLSSNTEPIPFNYQHQLTGALHKWLGQNDLHDKISFYSFSWLRGYSEVSNNKLIFPRGAQWFISFWEDEYTKKLVKGILADPSVIFGINVTSVEIQETPDFGEKNRFKVASPVLLRKNLENEEREHITFKDDSSSELMTERFLSKMNQAGISIGEKIPHLKFDKTYFQPKTKLADIKGIKLRTSVCPVIIEGTPETLKFAWNVGVGELTGSGFGAIE